MRKVATTAGRSEIFAGRIVADSVVSAPAEKM